MIYSKLFTGSTKSTKLFIEKEKDFNHTMIFFKLTDQYKISDIYLNHNNC